MGQRLYFRTANFGFLFAFNLKHFFATLTSVAPMTFRYFLIGIPIWVNRASAISSFFAEVTIVMFIPLIFSTLS